MSNYHSFLFFPPLNSVYLPHHYSLPFATFMPLHFTVTIELQFYFQTICSSSIFILPLKPINSVSYSAFMHTCLHADLYAWKFFHYSALLYNIILLCIEITQSFQKAYENKSTSGNMLFHFHCFHA